MKNLRIFFVLFSIALFPFQNALSQEKIEISKRVGFEIDSVERAYFHFLPGFRNFKSANIKRISEVEIKIVIEFTSEVGKSKDSVIEIDEFELNQIIKYFTDFEKIIFSLSKTDFNYIEKNKIYPGIINKYFKIAKYYIDPISITTANKSGEIVRGKLAYINEDYIIILKENNEFDIKNRDSYVCLSYREIDYILDYFTIHIRGSREAFKKYYLNKRDKDIINIEKFTPIIIPQLFIDLIDVKERSGIKNYYTDNITIEKLRKLEYGYFSICFGTEYFHSSNIYNFNFTTKYKSASKTREYTGRGGEESYLFIGPELLYNFNRHISAGLGYKYVFGIASETPEENISGSSVFLSGIFHLTDHGPYFASIFDIVRTYIKFNLFYNFSLESKIPLYTDNFYFEQPIYADYNTSLFGVITNLGVDILIADNLTINLGVEYLYALGGNDRYEFEYESPYKFKYDITIEQPIEKMNTFGGSIGVQYKIF